MNRPRRALLAIHELDRLNQEDLWAFMVLTGILQREQDLLRYLETARRPDGTPFRPGMGWASAHKLELQRMLFHLGEQEGLSAATRSALASILETLLARQGKDLPQWKGFWLSIDGDDGLPGDALIDFAVEYSTLCAGFLHMGVAHGATYQGDSAKVDQALVRFFADFTRDGQFPCHGFDMDLDYEAHAKFLAIGHLDDWLVAHWDEVPGFQEAAVGLLDFECAHGPVSNPNVFYEDGRPPKDGDGSFSPLGDLCLEILAKVKLGNR